MIFLESDEEVNVPMNINIYEYMLWLFKFILGLKFFELVSILFAIVPDFVTIEPVLKILAQN